MRIQLPAGVLLLVAMLAGCAVLNRSNHHAAVPELSAIGQGWAGSSINVVANRRQSLFTEGSHQFAAYYDGDGYMVLAQRQQADGRWGAWQTQRTSHRGKVADAHNSISIAVDGAGYLHVSWDHHAQPLNYARSLKPLSLDLGPSQALNGEAESRVTYPELYRLPDGDLLCLYRDGASGRGRLLLKRYSVREQQWRTVQGNLIDGEGARSPYWGLNVDARGGLHLGWIWRESPDVASNHDLAYAYSPDGGRSWRSAEGRELKPPFTLANAAYALRIPQHSKLMNSPWVIADDAGRPYLLSYWSPEPGSVPQFQLVRYDGQQWQREVITHRSQNFELEGSATRRPPISRGVLLPGPGAQPSAHLVYRDDAHEGRALMLSTTAIGSGIWSERELLTTPLGAWEPTIDPVQWQMNRQIHLLWQTVDQRDGEDDKAVKVPATAVGVLAVETR